MTRRLLALALLLSACDASIVEPALAERRGRAFGQKGGPSVNAHAAAQPITLEAGIKTVLFDGAELTTGAPNSPTHAYAAFPSEALPTAGGSWIVAYRRAQNHGISTPPTSSIRLARSDNEGLSWSDRFTETVVVPVSDFYDPYSPSLSRLSDDRVVLKYEKDWVTNATADFASVFDESAGTYTSDLTDFNDGGSGDLAIFPGTEAVNDAIVVGHSEPFTSIEWDSSPGGTAGVGGTVAWEFWNGSAWASLSGVTDGTSGFTASPISIGQITRWTQPGTWATTSLSGSPQLYFVRARITQVYSTNPIYTFGALSAAPVDNGTRLERTVHLRFSDDDGLTWGSEIEMARPTGLSPGLRYTSGGGPIKELPSGDLISGDYFRQLSQIRYTAYCSVSEDGGATWTFREIIAQHPSTTNSTNDGGFQFEETQIHVRGDRLISLIRVDDTTHPIGDSAADAQIFVSFSDDEGLTWSAYEIAFPGNGWPAIGETTNGVLVATTRDNLDTGGLVNRPTIWVSRTGAPGSWQGPIFYGDDSLASPRYMYAGVNEHPSKPNHIVIAAGQEVTLNNSCRIFVSEYAVNTDLIVPAYYSTDSLLFDNGNASFVTYDNNTVLDGVSRFTLTWFGRHDVNAGGTQNVIGMLTTDRQIRVYWSTGTTLNVAIATGASTEATWTSAAGISLLDHNDFFFVVFDGTQTGNANRLRVWHKDDYDSTAEITGAGSFSGTIPASVRSSASAWYLGASAGAAGSNPRTRYFDNIIIWAGVAATTSADAIYNRGVAVNPSATSLGASTVWLPLDGSFVDARGGLANPTVTGTGMSFSNLWTNGPGYLAP